MVFKVNNNGDSFKLPKIKLDLSKGLTGAESSASIFAGKNVKDDTLYPLNFNFSEMQKEETDTYISYTHNGMKTTFYKRENSEEFESIKYESEYFDDIKQYQVFYNEKGNQIRKEELFKDDNELATREILYREDNSKIPTYQKDVFKEGEQFLTRETFYDEEGNATIKTVCANGDIIIQKKLSNQEALSSEISIQKKSFGLSNADIFIKNEKGELVKAGNIFDNKYGITLNDLHLPKMRELSKEELRDFPEGKAIIIEKQLPNGKNLQEIGCYKNGQFVSLAPNRYGEIEEKIYSINGDKGNLRLERSKCGTVTTDYIYTNNNNFTAESRDNGEPLYFITTDSKGYKVKTYAYHKTPFSRTYFDRSGNEVIEFFNCKKKKWMKEYPAQPVFISYTPISGKSPLLLDKLKEMPFGTEVKVEVVNGHLGLKVFNAKYQELKEPDGTKTKCYVYEFTCKDTDKNYMLVFEVLDDYSAGRCLYRGESLY